MIVLQPKSEEELNAPDGKLWATIHAAFVRNGHPRQLIVNEIEWTQIRDGDVRNYSGDPGSTAGGFQKYGQESFGKEPKLTVEVTESSINKEATDFGDAE